MTTDIEEIRNDDQKYITFFAKNKRPDLFTKYIDYVVFNSISGHINYWKLLINKEQFSHLQLKLIEKDLFLNLELLQSKSDYFLPNPSGIIFDISERSLDVFDFLIEKDKKVQEVNDD